MSPPGKAEREQMLEMLLSELDGMAYRCRVDAQWTMEFVSEGCAALTGYQPEELLHNSAISFEALTHPEDRARVRDTVHRAIDEGRGYSLEYRIRARGGEIKWVWERGRRLPPRDGRPPMVHGFIQDISTLIAQRQALASAEQRYRSIFENANEGIFQTTEDGHYLEVNPALAAIYGYASPTALVAALVNISRQLYVEPARREEFVRLMREQGRVSNFESRVYRRDGSIIWISENAHAVKAADGSLLYYEGTVEDITARKSYEEQISWQATHDSLTELPNRILLTERIQATIRHADRHEGSFAVVFLDLDHFKNVNDTFGHAGGDQLIRKIAARLRACLREGDTVARLGGDEFVLLLPDIHRQAESLGLLLQRVLSTVRQPCRLGEREYPVSCSIGISIYPDDGRDAQTLLKHADIAMYQAKESGRDNFQFFSEEFNRLVVENVELEHALRAGLQRAEFELYFQPIFDMAGERVLKAEALLRWNPRGGMVSPSRFIPIAERSGLIDLLGDWVLERVVRQQREWCERGLPVVPLSLNISPRQFLQPDLVDSLAAALQRHDLPARLLEIEITENCLARDRQRFLRCLEEIKSLGIGIALDDFGSGYSNMESLKAMHFDSLKIDRSFITEVENGKNHQAIYRAIVSLAHNLHMTVVAEGVETRGQIDFLRGIPCDAVQGFYYSRPLPAAAFESLLALEQPPLQTSA